MAVKHIIHFHKYKNPAKEIERFLAVPGNKILTDNSEGLSPLNKCFDRLTKENETDQ